MKSISALLFLVVTATPLAAQWSVEAQAGRIRSALHPSSEGFESIALGVRYDQMNSLFRVSAGIPTGGDQPLWGSIAGAHRFALRPGMFVAGVDVAANAFVLHDRVQRTQEIEDVFRQRRVVPAPAQSGYAGAFQAMPVIGVETSKIQAHVRAGVSRYASEFADVRFDRTVTAADAQLTLLPSSSVAIMPVVRHFIADEGDHTYGGVTAVAGKSGLTVWGSTGQWLTLDQQEITWAAGASLRLQERLTLSGSARRDVFDPLYNTPGQTAWQVGVAVKLGNVAPLSAPVPAVFDAGKATIRLPAAHTAAPPRVAGDFTNWKPQPMQRSGDAWVYAVSLQPGVYNYAFVDESGNWFVPEKYPGRKQDGMGGVVAVLVVK